MPRSFAQGRWTGSSHTYSSHCSALSIKQLCLFITGFIFIGLFTATPKQQKKKRWEASAVMETAVRASAENWNCCQASMCLSNPGIRKPKKEAVIVKSNGGENLSYLILVFYASFGPLKTS